MAASRLIHTFATVTQVGEARRSQLDDIPPDGIDDFLAWRTLDETSGFANDGQLDGISDGLFEVIISFLSRIFEDGWIASHVDWPICGDGQGEVE